MFLGNRKIRSAGRSSGSIEVTLPAQLQALEGIECRLIVRDGARPEIVLQPDLSVALSFLRDFWQKLRLGLGEVEDIGDFAHTDFTIGLFAPPHWQERPPLACADVLAVLRRQNNYDERITEALTRLVASLAIAAGHRLGLNGSLALAFGNAAAYLMSGASAGPGADFERGLAHQILSVGDSGAGNPGSPLDLRSWQQARPGLRRIYEQFQYWHDNPTAYTAVRERWYRALTLEINSR